MKNNNIIFINVGEMTFYQGLDEGDEISGGGGYVKKHGYGHEIFNFKPYRGRYYGYGRPVNYTIALERFGAPSGSASVEGILVVWVAKSHVVGWYENARVYRAWQPPPPGSSRLYRKEGCGYYVTAKVADCKLLLPKDARTLRVPRGKGVIGGMGRYVWYPDNRHEQFLRALSDLIESKGEKYPTNRQTASGGGGWQVDPEKRKNIEIAAIKVTIRQYERWGYKTRSVQKECLGWDVEAEREGVKLLLEVKGLSGKDISVDLTPNEYYHLNKHRADYRVCVVTDALSRTGRKLSVFSYVEEENCWRDESGSLLNIQEIMAARVYV